MYLYINKWNLNYKFFEADLEMSVFKWEKYEQSSWPVGKNCSTSTEILQVGYTRYISLI